MFSLIITIVAIALVAALALATLYYGGAAFQKSTIEAQATRAITHGQQIQGAQDLFRADFGRWPTEAELLGANDRNFVYLRAWPEFALAPVTPQVTGPAFAADGSTPWFIPAPLQPTAVLSGTVTEAVCAAINKKSRGDDGISRTLSRSYATQCFSPEDDVFTVVVTKATMAELEQIVDPLTPNGWVVRDGPLPLDNPGDSTWFKPPGVTVSGGGGGAEPPDAPIVKPSATPEPPPSPQVALEIRGRDVFGAVEFESTPTAYGAHVTIPYVDASFFVNIENKGATAVTLSSPQDPAYVSAATLAAGASPDNDPPYNTPEGTVQAYDQFLQESFAPANVGMCRPGQQLSPGQACAALVEPQPGSCAPFTLNFGATTATFGFAAGACPGQASTLVLVGGAGPAAVDFGSIVASDTQLSRTFVVANTGPDTIPIEVRSMGGTQMLNNQFDYPLDQHITYANNCGSQVAGYQRCTITVRLVAQARAFSDGVFTHDFAVIDKRSPSDDEYVGVGAVANWTVVGSPAISFSTAAPSFTFTGLRNIPLAARQASFTLTNTGAKPFTLENGTTVAAGQSVVLQGALHSTMEYYMYPLASGTTTDVLDGEGLFVRNTRTNTLTSVKPQVQVTLTAVPPSQPDDQPEGVTLDQEDFTVMPSPTTLTNRFGDVNERKVQGGYNFCYITMATNAPPGISRFSLICGY